MNKQELEKFKKRLLEDRERILADINGLENDTLDREGRYSSDNRSRYASHIADAADQDYTRSFNLNLASNERRILREIDEALDKIEAGTIGVCESCGGRIPLKRLRAKPSARHCLKCVEKMEEEGIL